MFLGTKLMCLDNFFIYKKLKFFVYLLLKIYYFNSLISSFERPFRTCRFQFFLI